MNHLFFYYGYNHSGITGGAICVGTKHIQSIIFENGRAFPVINGKPVEFGMDDQTFKIFKKEYLVTIETLTFKHTRNEI